MQHSLDGQAVHSVRFCPYQDVLALGHAAGISTVLVPGAGEPNFDSFVANPYQTGKQRREGEVHQLLDKLQPETIMMDPSRIGMVRFVSTSGHRLASRCPGPPCFCQLADFVALLLKSRPCAPFLPLVKPSTSAARIS